MFIPKSNLIITALIFFLTIFVIKNSFAKQGQNNFLCKKKGFLNAIFGVMGAEGIESKIA